VQTRPDAVETNTFGRNLVNLGNDEIADTVLRGGDELGVPDVDRVTT